MTQSLRASRRKTRASLAEQIRWAVDPIAWFQDACQFDADEWQTAFTYQVYNLEADGRTPTQAALEGINRHILTASRQVGKSTVAAAIASHWASFRRPEMNIQVPGAAPRRKVLKGHADVLIFSLSRRQASEVLARVYDFLIAGGVQILRKSDERIELINGGTIRAVPATSGARGYSADLILLDELGWAGEVDEILASVSPILASRAIDASAMLCLSSPGPAAGWYYNAYSDPSKYRVTKTVTAWGQCDRISPDFIESERARLGDLLFMTEYGDRELGPQFLEVGASVMDLRAIRAAVQPDTDDEAVEMPSFMSVVGG